MRLGEKELARLPAHLQRLFTKLPNPGSEEVVSAFPETTTSERKPHHDIGRTHQSTYGAPSGKQYKAGNTHGDSGSAARFFYCAKASRADRNDGLEAFRNVRAAEVTGRKEGSAGLVMKGGKANPFAGPSGEVRKNTHPTVKPTELMRYLCRLVTPPGGLVLDPFMGSGSTGRGALREGFRFIGIEIEPSYFDIACRRIEAAAKAPQLPLAAA